MTGPFKCQECGENDVEEDCDICDECFYDEENEEDEDDGEEDGG